MWRHLSNNVVLVAQQVDAVRAAWCVFRLISVSVLATEQGNTPLTGRLHDIGLVMYAKFGCCTMLPNSVFSFPNRSTNSHFRQWPP